MNRCQWCGLGIPKDRVLCDTCHGAGASVDDKGWLTVPSTECVCKLDELTVTGQPEAVVPTQDKSLIWEDCPACAMKHLGAAYAAVTSPDCGIVCATQTDVLEARSVIAIRECESGYSGNAAIAAGCLALAETVEGGYPESRKNWRAARLLLLEGKLHEAEALLVPVTLAAMAGGHIAEALRELPELADRTCIGSLFSDGNFDPDTASGLRDWLRESIGWIMKTHELGVGE